jgi:cyanophycinase
MFLMTQRPHIGALALVGSGEYLDVMNTTDGALLERQGGANAAHVALLPTASGLEPQGPQSWNTLGLRHFHALGVDDVRATQIIDRATASDPAQLELLRGANFYYFSGGNPQHVIESLRDTPAWDIIASAHRNGATLAGCSAGAMAFGGLTLKIREALSGNPPVWVPALSLVPHLVTFPHFDRMAGWIDKGALQQLFVTLPAGTTVLGIDEKTALVRVQEPADDAPGTPALWRVMGQQTVNIFRHGAGPEILHVDQEIRL